MKSHPEKTMPLLSRCHVGIAMVLAFALSACTPEGSLDVASPATSPQASMTNTDRSTFEPTYVAGEQASRTDTPAKPRSGSSAARTRTSRADARPAVRGEQMYYVEFRSRSAASYGHTFASIGKLDGSGKIETSEIVGLHPATESVLPWLIGHVVPVMSETGASDGDKEEIYWTARYRVRLNQQRYDEFMTKVRGLQASSPAWHAVFYNCNAFIGDVAKLLDLKVPGNSLLFPKEYIEELATLNGA